MDKRIAQFEGMKAHALTRWEQQWLQPEDRTAPEQAFEAFVSWVSDEGDGADAPPTEAHELNAVTRELWRSFATGWNGV